MMNTTRRYNSHKNCAHASTKVARATCRKSGSVSNEKAVNTHVLAAHSKVMHELLSNDAGTLFLCTRKSVKDSAHLMPSFEALSSLETNADLTMCKNCVKTSARLLAK